MYQHQHLVRLATAKQPLAWQVVNFPGEIILSLEIIIDVPACKFTPKGSICNIF
jgi:hypothetical protein